MFPEQKILVYSTSNYLSDEISHILGKKGMVGTNNENSVLSYSNETKFWVLQNLWLPVGEKHICKGSVFWNVKSHTPSTWNLSPLSISYATFTHYNWFLFPNWLLSKRTDELVCVNCKENNNTKTANVWKFLVRNSVMQ